MMTQTEHPQSDFMAAWTRAQPLVSSYLGSAIRSSHDADDVLQEVATTAFENYDQYDRERPFLPWALGIARHRVLQHYRSRGARALTFDVEVLDQLARAHEKLEPLVSERRAALETCLQQINERSRRVLELRYNDNLKVSEIALRFKTSSNAISLLLFKVRRALSECIDRRLAREGGR